MIVVLVALLGLTAPHAIVLGVVVGGTLPGAPMILAFEVLGDPAPKGSPRVVTKSRGRALAKPKVLSDSPRTVAWQQAVAWHARLAIHGARCRMFEGEALDVEIRFVFVRPRTSNRARPIGKPDLDKLIRTTLDGLSGIAFDDDARVVSLRACKVWGNSTGARIEIRTLDEGGNG